VVSQILAYGAYLYGLTLETIERDILGQELRRRGHDNLVGALSAHNQTGSLQPDDFALALADNLASGSFRLVLVLDQAPDELVRLVGYLEAVTEGLVIDLITVSRYEVDGQRVMVPQRVDPERWSGLEARPGPASTGAQGYLDRSIEGIDTFVAGVSEKERPTPQMLVAWAVELQREGVARLATWHGKQGKNVLVWLLGKDVGLTHIALRKSN
jgi:hypothetical protein